VATIEEFAEEFVEELARQLVEQTISPHYRTKVSDAEFLVELLKGGMLGSEVMDFLQVNRAQRHRRCRMLERMELIKQERVSLDGRRTLAVGLTRLGMDVAMILKTHVRFQIDYKRRTALIEIQPSIADELYQEADFELEAFLNDLTEEE